MKSVKRVAETGHSHLGGVSAEAFEKPRREDKNCLLGYGHSTPD